MKKLDFKTAFNYPFKRPKGMCYILWILLPIFGWFALGGYGIRLVKEFSKGKFKQLPVLKFKSDIKLGFWMFLKSIPFILVYGVVMSIINYTNPWAGGIIRTLLEIFVVPILFIHFFNKETVKSLFDFKILKSVFNSIGDYIVTILKSILLAVTFLL